MVWQAAIDDSYNQDSIFVLGGFVATAEAWANFSRDWEELLPWGTLTKDNKHHFKMSEMAASPDRMERAAAFFRVIEKHITAAVACKIDIRDLRRALNRIWIPGRQYGSATTIDWSAWSNPYVMAFRCLMDQFHLRRDEMTEVFPLDEPIDFIFDMQTEKKIIRDAWDEYLQKRNPEIRHRFGEEPRFLDDRVFLPLQAADLWAWHVREWFEDGDTNGLKKLSDMEFSAWQAKWKFPRILIAFDEDALTRLLMEAARAAAGPNRIIYDVRFSEPKSS
jgi:hypothetical protein